VKTYNFLSDLAERQTDIGENVTFFLCLDRGR